MSSMGAQAPEKTERPAAKREAQQPKATTAPRATRQADKRAAHAPVKRPAAAQRAAPRNHRRLRLPSASALSKGRAWAARTASGAVRRRTSAHRKKVLPRQATPAAKTVGPKPVLARGVGRDSNCALI